MASLGRRLQALAALAGVVSFAVAYPAQGQQTVNLAKCWADFVDPQDPAKATYYYDGSFPVVPSQDTVTRLSTHLTDQVSVALAPKRAQLDPALAQALPIVKETDHDLLFVELRPDEQGGFALKATPYHRPFRPNGQPQALEMFAFRASDQAVLARGGSAAGEAPNLALGADMLASPFSIVIVDEQGKTYYRADYSVDMNTLRRRASTALAAGRKTYEGVSYDTTPGAHGGLANCAEGAGGGDDDYDGACFLTTATVRTIGLSDDCWELRQLRAFRDRFAALGPRQQAAMRRYYVISPPIVRAIDARPDGAAIWLRVYFTAILPAAIAACLRRDRLALAIYRRLVGRLRVLARPSVQAARA
jgi:hypothetical protein